MNVSLTHDEVRKAVQMYIRAQLDYSIRDKVTILASLYPRGTAFACSASVNPVSAARQVVAKIEQARDAAEAK